MQNIQIKNLYSEMKKINNKISNLNDNQKEKCSVEYLSTYNKIVSCIDELNLIKKKLK